MGIQETIFALSTPPGKSGVAVMRISGSGAVQSLKILGIATLPTPRMATICTLRNPETGHIIDHALVLYFPAPHSFTGEDVVELHTHGSRAVSAEIAGVLGKIPGNRLSEPGEFTKRAFYNHKFDLTVAEAIGDLIHADTEAQKRQALRQMGG